MFKARITTGCHPRYPYNIKTILHATLQVTDTAYVILNVQINACK